MGRYLVKVSVPVEYIVEEGREASSHPYARRLSPEGFRACVYDEMEEVEEGILTEGSSRPSEDRSREESDALGGRADDIADERCECEECVAAMVWRSTIIHGWIFKGKRSLLHSVGMMIEKSIYTCIFLRNFLRYILEITCQ